MYVYSNKNARRVVLFRVLWQKIADMFRVRQVTADLELEFQKIQNRSFAGNPKVPEIGNCQKIRMYTLQFKNVSLYP
jgi:hypothetical protein